MLGNLDEKIYTQKVSPIKKFNIQPCNIFTEGKKPKVSSLTYLQNVYSSTQKTPHILLLLILEYHI